MIKDGSEPNAGYLFMLVRRERAQDIVVHFGALNVSYGGESLYDYAVRCYGYSHIIPCIILASLLVTNT